MTNEELARPVTEAEASGLLELVTNLGEVCGYRPADVLRRLLFERDRLRANVTELQAVDAERVSELEAAIRQHRDERGDDRCHADDGRLYAVLPEGDTRPARETAVTLENCARYIECRQTGREYVSPQRRIKELEAEVARLRAGQAH